jgi:dipeptide/tripeptide permease
MLLVSYLAYLPSILLLIVTKSFTGIALTMLCIGFAAGIFKPLISATIRAVTDSTNKTLGFGIFYQMVNVGASFGPIVAGNLRIISWNYAFYASAIGIGLMFLVTLFFYKEPPREIEGVTLRQKFKDIYVALSDGKFLTFIILLGLFFWLPFWAFFNVTPIYIGEHIDTAILYKNVRSVLGPWIAELISGDIDGAKRVIGETIAHTGYIILIFQFIISRIFEKRPALPSFNLGLFIAALGFLFLGLAKISAPAVVFIGIFLFAVGEMISSPRIQEYITWIAPKEKAGLYMGTNFLATFIGGVLSGQYTSLLGKFEASGHPEYIMYTLGVHLILGIIAIFVFVKTLGEFKEMDK